MIVKKWQVQLALPMPGTASLSHHPPTLPSLCKIQANKICFWPDGDHTSQCLWADNSSNQSILKGSYYGGIG